MRNGAQYLIYQLPDEVLLTIFSYLFEQDLCRIAQVCTRFYKISNDCELWKSLYHDLFEYDHPLYYTIPDGQYRFKFIPVAERDPNQDNPWKDSFSKLVICIFILFIYLPVKLFF